MILGKSIKRFRRLTFFRVAPKRWRVRLCLTNLKEKKGAWFAKNDGFFYFLKRLRINGYSVSMYTLVHLMCTVFGLFRSFFYRRIKKGRGQIILWSLLFYFYLCKYFFGKLYKSTLGFVDYSQNEYMKLLKIVYQEPFKSKEI